MPASLLTPTRRTPLLRRLETVHVVNVAGDRAIQELDWMPGDRVITVHADGSVREVDLSFQDNGNDSERE